MLVIAPIVPAARQASDITGSATFVILVAGTRIGTESVSLTRTSTGWLVSGAGRLQPPVDLTTNRFEVSYGVDWQPQQMAIESSLKGQPLTLTTTFGLTTASTEMRRGAERGATTNVVTPRAVVLPPNFFAAYESLAVRLGASAVGARIPVHVPGSGESNITVAQINARRVSLGDQALDLREFVMTLATSSGATPVEVWIDGRSRLARLLLPTSGLVAIREDLATVMAREERARNPGDADEFIGATGFSLGATITRPTTGTGRAPAVILVSAPGPQDRDYVAYGVPIFAQLAGRLAEAGYLTVRYDPRGTGRSGGRAETARLTEYSDDLINVVKWLKKRRDVDERRISIVGYGDGGPIALLTASREKSIAGVALLASPGRTGREVTLEQQQLSLARSSLTEVDRSSRLALQTRIIEAVLTGRGWEGVPDDVRSQADTQWFKSWLVFDPSAIARRVAQPVLIVHGELDAETPVAHAARLETIFKERKGAPAAHTQIRVLPAVNHLFLPAKTGQVDEYLSLDTRAISPDVGQLMAEWLRTSAIRR
jgi:pimeloyl-ACP methyl ester carboxylesterase